MVSILDLEKSFENEECIEVGGTVLDLGTIGILLLIYSALTKERLKAKFIRMLNNETDRLVDFCYNHVEQGIIRCKEGKYVKYTL